MTSKAIRKRSNEEAQQALQAAKGEIGKLKNGNNGDFRDGVIDALKQTLSYSAMAQENNAKERDDILANLRKRFKTMDLGFDKLFDEFVEFKKGFDNLRFYLLLQTARAEYAYKKLVEIGIIENWTDELSNMIWTDEYVAMLGFDCTAEELRQIFIDSSKKTNGGAFQDIEP